MCVPVPAVSHVRSLLETHLPALRPAQHRGLAEWVAGVLATGSGCEAAILAALAPLGVEPQALRARLREFLYDGAERAAPCAVSLDVEACCAPLLAWSAACRPSWAIVASLSTAPLAVSGPQWPWLVYSQ